MKSKRGRPTVMTQGVIDKLEQAFSAGATDGEACFYAGIATDTLYKYQVENPDYIKRKEALKNDLVLQSRFNVQKIIKSEDKDISKWYLERKKKDEFSIRTESDIQLQVEQIKGINYITPVESIALDFVEPNKLETQTVKSLEMKLPTREQSKEDLTKG